MQNQHRQLAAILFTDIVGYTALMQENEQKAVALIKHYNAALNESVGLHNGKVLNYYGDGSLCSFPSVTEALYCAIELQKELQAEPSVPLRIGLHVGEVFFENEKALGDGVNVASRIQSLGQANTIFFSKEIFDKIRNQPEFKSISIGFFEFKNVDQPMEIFALANEGLHIPKKETLEGKLKSGLPQKNRTVQIKAITAITIVLLLVAGYFIYSMFFKKAGFTGRDKSIAVLPFTNMSTDKDNEFFSDGMTEEITTQLTKIAELKVIGSTSSMSYKGSKKSIKEIAEELGVASILEGSVQKTGNQIKIIAKLIDVSSLQNIWANTWDREFKEVFTIQSEVAQQIAFQLKANLTNEEKKNIEKKPTNNPEAYQYYLQGNQLHNSFWQTRSLDLFESSKAMFEKALNLDSNYGLVHAALADLYNTYTNQIKKDSVILSLQLKEIKKAWEIDSTNDYVVSVRGVIEQSTTGNKELGFKYLKKAVELNPNNPLNLWSLGQMIGTEFGLIDESLILFDRAVKLDPLTANNFSFRGICSYSLGKNEDAIKDLETAIRLEPQFVGAIDALAHVYSFVGRIDDARKMIERSLKINPTLDEHWKPSLAYAYSRFGNKKKALELAPNDWNVLLALGMTEEALKAMPYYTESKKDLNTPYLTFKYLLATKNLDALKNDPRFLKILERSKKQYEENKKKFSVADIIAKFPSSTP